MKNFKCLFSINKFDLKEYTKEANLHLGCGNRPLDNFINIDFYNIKFADEILDLNDKLPYKDNSIDLIYSDNVFEHINNLLGLIRECHRILKPGAALIVSAPYFKSKHAFVDPTHLHFFTIQSMDYFVKNKYFYDQYKFFDESFEDILIYLDPENQSFIKKLISCIAIKKHNYFENSIWSNFFVFHNIIYVLRK